MEHSRQGAGRRRTLGFSVRLSVTCCPGLTVLVTLVPQDLDLSDNFARVQLGTNRIKQQIEKGLLHKTEENISQPLQK